MLVLGRKPGEYIVVNYNGLDVKVQVIKSEDGHLRLAIDAPKEVKITRGEVWEEKQFQISEKDIEKNGIKERTTI
ncbi:MULTISPECIES: carbon storage regulator [Clostridium]|uniref:Translational regulator CsrA n=1 Tax=Clostridium senegalense TaxID=1465809 RepID=A0A6M0H6A1_9CLOT|nr:MULTISPECIES: carbon storage regulator [Clostridium]MBU5226057.1 carbon storage regulator [Clostridium senegalense]NEU05858.1 carbon storage regulator [Clostridium senegalense]